MGERGGEGRWRGEQNGTGGEDCGDGGEKKEPECCNITQPAENLGQGGNEEGNYECIEEGASKGRGG